MPQVIKKRKETIEVLELFRELAKQVLFDTSPTRKRARQRTLHLQQQRQYLTKSDGTGTTTYFLATPKSEKILPLELKAWRCPGPLQKVPWPWRRGLSRCRQSGGHRGIFRRETYRRYRISKDRFSRQTKW